MALQRPVHVLFWRVGVLTFRRLPPCPRAFSGHAHLFSQFSPFSPHTLRAASALMNEGRPKAFLSFVGAPGGRWMWTSAAASGGCCLDATSREKAGSVAESDDPRRSRIAPSGFFMHPPHPGTQHS